MTKELFISFHYPEIKELTVTFLTLCSSIFTLSVVFAEKLAPEKGEKAQGYIALFASWLSLIAALILGGIGLLRLLVLADLAKGGNLIVGNFLFSDNGDFGSYVYSVYGQLFISGVFFVGGLILLALSAFYRLFKRSS